ncbi:hypothetical protein F4Y93_00680 [Candidatus Poribacteria bacterium]|nr:hypothetical protein [Candidatus Poribacteria bacterium]
MRQMLIAFFIPALLSLFVVASAQTPAPANNDSKEEKMDSISWTEVVILIVAIAGLGLSVATFTQQQLRNLKNDIMEHIDRHETELTETSELANENKAALDRIRKNL